MRCSTKPAVLAFVSAVIASKSALAVIPYTPVPTTGLPTLGPGMLPPDVVYGK